MITKYSGRSFPRFKQLGLHSVLYVCCGEPILSLVQILFPLSVSNSLSVSYPKKVKQHFKPNNLLSLEGSVIHRNETTH